MLTFGYFGKLPMYPDFISYNTGGTEILAMDKWIQDGLIFGKNKLKSAWKEYYDGSPAHNFVYPFTNTTKVLAGTIFPSQDKSKREFPFITFVKYDTKYLNITAHLIPVQFSGVFSSFRHSYENLLLNNNFSLPHIEIILSKSRQAESNSVFLNYLNSPQNDFWKRTSGNQGNDFKYALVYTLVYYLMGQQDKTIPSLTSGIKITFTSTKDYEELDLAFFIKLLLTISNKNSYIPAIFWTVKEEYVEAFFF